MGVLFLPLTPQTVPYTGPLRIPTFGLSSQAVYNVCLCRREGKLDALEPDNCSSASEINCRIFSSVCFYLVIFRLPERGISSVCFLFDIKAGTTTH